MSGPVPGLAEEKPAQVDVAGGGASPGTQDEGGRSSMGGFGVEGPVAGDASTPDATPEISLSNAAGENEASPENYAARGTRGISERAVKAAEASAVAIRAQGKGKGGRRKRRVLEEDDSDNDSDRCVSYTGGLVSSRDSVIVDLKLDAEGPRSSPSTVCDGALSTGCVAVPGSGIKDREQHQEEGVGEEKEEEEACWSEGCKEDFGTPRAAPLGATAAAFSAVVQQRANGDVSTTGERTLSATTTDKGKGKGKANWRSGGRWRRRLVTSDCSSEDSNDDGSDSAAATATASVVTRNREGSSSNWGGARGSLGRRGRGGVEAATARELGQGTEGNAASSGAQGGNDGQRQRRRPVRATASVGINYAALHEGMPLDEDENEGGSSVNGIDRDRSVIEVSSGGSDEDSGEGVVQRKRKRNLTSSTSNSVSRSKSRSKRKSNKISHDMRDFIARSSGSSSSSSEEEAHREDDGEAARNARTYGDDSDEDDRQTLHAKRTRMSASRRRTAAAVRQYSTRERSKRRAGKKRTVQKSRPSRSRSLECTHGDAGGAVGD
ncbi:unnamed protein product, partial [Scytosiphon promiscuus]